MIRALFLVWNPVTIWERISKDRHSLKFILLAYLLPLMLIASLGEGMGMIKWRTLSAGVQGIAYFTPGQALVFEIMRLALMFLIFVACVHIIWLLKEPFFASYNYGEVVTLVAYSFFPLFLFQPLNGVPWLNLWMPWAAGILLTLRIFYYGLRITARCDPLWALSLYFLSSMVIVGLTGAQQFILIQCLTGHGASINNLIIEIAAKLPF